ncbi:hypothetical protein HMPREF3231_01987 [Bifidobacterium longum]|nr:hypothetical protein HMPREF3231_01987 [Bifidobacterium longum]
MEKPAMNANIANEQSPVAVPPASWFLRAFAGVLTCSLSVSVCSLLRLACVLYVLSVS